MTETPNTVPGTPAPVDGVPRPVPGPRGFAVRRSAEASSGSWTDVFPLPDGRTGVVVTSCARESAAKRLAHRLRNALERDDGDSVREFGDPASAAYAVIDAATVRYGTHGDATVLVIPDDGGSPGRRDLAPGATVVLSTAPIADGALLGTAAALHPDLVAERASPRAIDTGAVATVVYRHPPAPMTITLPAAASSLAISRGRMREWLAEAGLDPELCADVLLAVGEATANATEHAVVGADRQVHLTVSAALTGNRLQLTVSDDGRWKPATTPRGHRGHGIHLINALVDTVALTTAPDGTTVEMLKELP